MIATLYHILAILYGPLLWLLVVFHALLGVVGLAAPGRLRAFVAALMGKGRIRALGAVLLVVGAMLFIGAETSSVPFLGKFLAILFFIDGGVRLVMPTVSVVYSEWIVGWSDGTQRLLALAVLALAVFFYLAAQVPPLPITDVADPERLTAMAGLLRDGARSGSA